MLLNEFPSGILSDLNLTIIYRTVHPRIRTFLTVEILPVISVQFQFEWIQIQIVRILMTALSGLSAISYIETESWYQPIGKIETQS